MKLIRAVKIRNKEDGSRNENTGKTLTANKCVNCDRKYAGPEITGGKKLDK
jgi:hypothetical protein